MTCLDCTKKNVCSDWRRMYPCTCFEQRKLENVKKYFANTNRKGELTNE